MAQRFLTTVPRYVDGQYINADVEHPAEVTFPEHIKVNPDEIKMRTLIPIGAEIPEPPKLKAPYAEVRRGPPGQARQIEKPGRRPSDNEPT